jgi:predicted DNA-binding transcriptional regulator AlpA
MNFPELLTTVQQLDMSDREIGALLAALAGKMAAKPEPEAPDNDAGDELLTVAEVAPRLGKSTSWLYHNWRSLPFAVPGIGKAPRFSRRGLEAHIAKRRRC